MGQGAKEYEAGSYERPEHREALQGQLALFPAPSRPVRVDPCPPTSGCKGSGLVTDDEGTMAYCTCPIGTNLYREEVG